jgi:hypothetical protein
MSNGHEKRLSRLEERAAERSKQLAVCNCRVETRCHNAACLGAILKGISRVCPLHGFRVLGFFFWTSKQYLLLPQDNQFCPCPPHPWRSFLSEGPHTWEGHDAAREAYRQLPPTPMLNYKDDKRQADLILEEYSEGRQQAVERGARLPDRADLVKLKWERARKHVKASGSLVQS